MKRIGVVLSGCGVMDGSEIHESVVTLLAIDRAGAQAHCLAPADDQHHVVNHLTNEPVEGVRRSIAEESARISRGEITLIEDVTPDDLDALILPGGFGAAKNLCSFAFDGPNCSVDETLASLLRGMIAARKPVGAMCIAPAVVAKAFEGTSYRPVLTIGTDAATAEGIEAMGAHHENCTPDDIVVDEEMQIVSTPAYMLAGGIAEAASGIEKLVAKVVEMA